MADIFISYSNTDRDRIIPIVKALEEQDWSVFWDWRCIPVGKTWRQFINEGLEEARCVLVLWSEKSIDSEWVIEEADYGKAKRILIPALIDDVRPPIGFGQIHAARLLGWMGETSHVGFQSLIEALTSLLEPTNVQVFTPESPRIESPKPEATESPISERPHKISPKKEITNNIGMEFVFIPAGSFTMGSNAGEEFEKPPHEVKILQSFYLQTTQITQGQWKKVIENNPSEFKDGGVECPVENVSWTDTQKFIKKFNDIEGTDKYRLPTEAEWEYACRAGAITEFSFGDDEGKLGEYAWFRNNSDHKTHSVGTKKTQSLGPLRLTRQCLGVGGGRLAKKLQHDS